jgi:ParB family chromosome partitioning protein
MIDKKSPLKQRNALGRGLSALLSDADNMNNSDGLDIPTPQVNYVMEIPIHYIEVNPYQPRTVFDEDALSELAESIRVQGIIQPITVRRLSENSYQLISGERRWQASKKIGLEKIPAYIRTANDQEMLEMALIENIQREDLNALEIAMSYQRLIAECNLNQEELGDRVGKKRSTVTNYLRLLKLPAEIQVALRDKQLTMGHARALLAIENIDLQLLIFRKIVAEEWSVRTTEDNIKKLLNPVTPPTAPQKNTTKENYALKQLQSKISSHLGTQVKIKDNGNEKGEITIPYHSVSDLNRILEILHII